MKNSPVPRGFFMDRQAVDQMGRTVFVPADPQRIISLVPSQTELLFDLGLASRVVGVTRFCVHPAEAMKTKEIIGGTKKFRFEVIDRLKPDLIIGNKEENYEEGINTLAARYPVWMSDIVSFTDALAMIRAVGLITNTPDRADDFVMRILNSWSNIQLPPARVLYLIWQEPWMAVGRHTFINSVIEKIGWTNVITSSRYPQITDPDIVELNPDVIVLSSEPFPFRDRHIAALSALCPHATVRLADGEMFSWYGSRMLKAADYFKSFQG
jgi:ABC-type Fe3+-hydroxamate transport system substrate-binding protein